MRTQAIRSLLAAIAALLWLPTAGCDLHDKTWDANSDSAAPGLPVNPSANPSLSSVDMVITVGTSGAISCNLNGAAIAPIRHRSETLDDATPACPILIVTDTARDTEESFAVPASLDSTSVSTEGQVTLRRLQHNLIIESNGAARILLYNSDSQDEIDDCVQFAGDADIDRLANRLTAAPSLIDGRDSKQGKTALIKAAEAGRPGVVLYLLKHKAATDIKDNDGYTALHRAVIQGRFEVVKLLVNHGADVNALTKAGNSPLRLANTRRFKDIAALLVGAGATGEIARDSPGRARPSVEEKSFELTDQNEYGPFPDGSSIRYADGLIYVLRADQASANNWDEFDLPKTHDAWIALQGTRLRVMVQGKEFRHVWASYHPSERDASR